MKTPKALAALATGTVALLTLTGCISIDVGVTIHSDATAEPSSSISYNKTQLAPILATQGVNDVCAFLREQQTIEDSESFTVIWSETDELCTQTMTSTRTYSFDENGITDSDITAGSATAGLQVVKVGEEAKVTFNSSSFTEGLEQNTGEFGWDTILSGFALHVTFPGKVTEANLSGVISNDGRTVTWDIAGLKAGIDTSTDLTATGELTPSGVNVLPFLLGGALLLLLIGGGVAFFLLRGRGKNSTADAATEAVAEVVAEAEASS